MLNCQSLVIPDTKHIKCAKHHWHVTIYLCCPYSVHSAINNKEFSGSFKTKKFRLLALKKFND